MAQAPWKTVWPSWLGPVRAQGPAQLRGRKGATSWAALDTAQRQRGELWNSLKAQLKGQLRRSQGPSAVHPDGGFL